MYTCTYAHVLECLCFLCLCVTQLHKRKEGDQFTAIVKHLSSVLASREVFSPVFILLPPHCYLISVVYTCPCPPPSVGSVPKMHVSRLTCAECAHSALLDSLRLCWERTRPSPTTLSLIPTASRSTSTPPALNHLWKGEGDVGGWEFSLHVLVYVLHCTVVAWFSWCVTFKSRATLCVSCLGLALSPGSRVCVSLTTGETGTCTFFTRFNLLINNCVWAGTVLHFSTFCW